MALADTGKAIGAVTEAIRLRLGVRTGLTATVGRPEPPASGGAVAKSLNLFLYEAQFDANLKNTPLDEGQRPPLWLILKYMLTAFDNDKNSDTVQALEYLGEGLRALQELAFLPVAGLPPDVLKPLGDNPEALRITFDDATPELLSKLMQGSDEKYRLSAAFQVRPVMIAPAETPSYSLLVGVDYITPPAPTIIGEAGVHIPVLPTMGPVITKVEPESFDPGATVTLEGTDLHVADLSVMLGPVELPVTMQQPDRLQFVVNEAIATPAVISAGSHPVSVSQLLPGGRRRASNLLVGNLRPVLDTAAIQAGTLQQVLVPPPPVGHRYATIGVTGKYLGRDGVDDFYLALYRNGATVKLFDALTDTSPAGAPQTQRSFAMQKADAVPPGQYLVLYRVNGQQARQAVAIDLT
jgi:hypothetical protein